MGANAWCENPSWTTRTQSAVGIQKPSPRRMPRPGGGLLAEHKRCAAQSAAKMATDTYDRMPILGGSQSNTYNLPMGTIQGPRGGGPF